MTTSKQLHLSAPSGRDLRLISEYTLRRWGAVQKKKYLGQIKDSFKLINENPGIGKPRDEIDKGLMSLAVQKHIIFYRQTKKQLFVVRILYESMDLARHLD